MGTNATDTSITDALAAAKELANNVLGSQAASSPQELRDTVSSYYLGNGVTYRTENSTSNWLPEQLDAEENRQRVIDYTEGFVHAIETMVVEFGTGLIYDDLGYRGMLTLLRDMRLATNGMIQQAEAGEQGSALQEVLDQRQSELDDALAKVMDRLRTNFERVDIDPSATTQE